MSNSLHTYFELTEGVSFVLDDLLGTMFPVAGSTCPMHFLLQTHFFLSGSQIDSFK